MATKTFAVALSKTNNKIRIEIDKDRLESLMNSCGLFRKDFLDTLKKSIKDHQVGRVTKRESLAELMG